MIPIKALLTVLTGASLCMANISGTVTDTGTTPMPGVRQPMRPAHGIVTSTPSSTTLAGAASIKVPVFRSGWLEIRVVGYLAF